MEELEQFTKTVITTFQRLFFFKFQFGLVCSAFLLEKQTAPILLHIYLHVCVCIYVFFFLPIYLISGTGAGKTDICLLNSFREPKHSLAIG